MGSHIAIEVQFSHGWDNLITAHYAISCNTEYMKRDLKRLSDFLTYANKEDHRDLMITATNSDNLNESIRFILEDFKNGYQKRNFSDNRYSEVPSKTFGTEGNARKEIKKDALKTIKAMALKTN